MQVQIIQSQFGPRFQVTQADGHVSLLTASADRRAENHVVAHLIHWGIDLDGADMLIAQAQIEVA